MSILGDIAVLLEFCGQHSGRNGGNRREFCAGRFGIAGDEESQCGREQFVGAARHGLEMANESGTKVIEEAGELVGGGNIGGRIHGSD